MIAFSSFYLADRLHPTIELLDERMLLLSKNGDWNEINLIEILSDERSPKVWREDLKKVLDRLSSSFPDNIT